jgi:bifunctional DNA-binding transcriptional regulator/antitoxin component of YhaV-PrlF toxin-antitoxin module
MPRRKLESKNIRSLSKTSHGKSYTITLPIDVVRRWKWKNRQKLQLTIDEKKKRIIIEDWTR